MARAPAAEAYFWYHTQRWSWRPNNWTQTAALASPINFDPTRQPFKWRCDRCVAFSEFDGSGSQCRVWLSTPASRSCIWPTPEWVETICFARHIAPLFFAKWVHDAQICLYEAMRRRWKDTSPSCSSENGHGTCSTAPQICHLPWSMWSKKLIWQYLAIFAALLSTTFHCLFDQCGSNNRKHCRNAKCAHLSCWILILARSPGIHAFFPGILAWRVLTQN